MKIRVWGYQDGELLTEGFEVDPNYTAGRQRVPEQEAAALAMVEGIIALANSVGVEVYIGTDQVDGDAPEWNKDVEEWLVPDGTNTPRGQ